MIAGDNAEVDYHGSLGRRAVHEASCCWTACNGISTILRDDTQFGKALVDDVSIQVELVAVHPCVIDLHGDQLHVKQSDTASQD